MKKKVPTLQEMAEFLRDAAYSDHQSHFIEWSCSVIHPRTKDGVVGFACGLFHKSVYSLPSSQKDQYYANVKRNIVVDFSFDEVNGVYNFNMWADHDPIRFTFGGKPTFDEFKQAVVDAFGIEKLYSHGRKWMILEEYNAREKL